MQWQLPLILECSRFLPFKHCVLITTSHISYILTYKVKYLTDEIHWKAAAFLCGNFDTVLLPEFGAAAMLKKRGLSSRTKRDMQAWAHGRFRERMLHKARETRTRVVVCGEAYTSKTCGHCGWQHDRLGSSKTFVCGQCGKVFDRDVNAARNVLLRNLVNCDLSIGWLEPR